MAVSARLAAAVRERAKDRCEYCRMPRAFDPIPFEIDHVVPTCHGGVTSLENCAFSCWRCNCFKGPNLAGIDDRTGRVVRLFHPRKDRWGTHFAWRGPVLVGRTGIGRVTVAVLRINSSHRVAHRRALIDEDVFPPRLDSPATHPTPPPPPSPRRT